MCVDWSPILPSMIISDYCRDAGALISLLDLLFQKHSIILTSIIQLVTTFKSALLPTVHKRCLKGYVLIVTDKQFAKKSDLSKLDFRTARITC